MRLPKCLTVKLSSPSLLIGLVVIKLTEDQLMDCEEALQTLITFLRKFISHTQEPVTNFIKSLKYALKDDTRESLFSRLQRIKSSLQITLEALSM